MRLGLTTATRGSETNFALRSPAVLFGALLKCVEDEAVTCESATPVDATSSPAIRGGSTGGGIETGCAEAGASKEMTALRVMPIAVRGVFTGSLTDLSQ